MIMKALLVLAQSSWNLKILLLMCVCSATCHNRLYRGGLLISLAAVEMHGLVPVHVITFLQDLA